MEIGKQIRALEWFRGLIGGKETDGVYVPQKPKLYPADGSGGFEELLPEQVGVRSAGLLKMFAGLSAAKGVNPHSAAVLRDGKLIAKADWSPYEIEYPHVSHSLCKSVVSMAVGLAASEKILFLTEKVAPIFKEELPKNPHKFMEKITVRNLLTMSSGADFNEAKAVMSKNWVRDFLSSEIKFPPGTDFHYNSLNSYMLSAIVCKRAGTSLSEYLNQRLFRPLGIKNFYWEKCPRGIEKGGWGLYMTLFDYAKLGQLYLNGGTWNGKRIIAESWVKESTSRQIVKGESPCRKGYGYQIWLTRGGYVFSGMLGQNVFVYPERRTVIALTAGSDAVFPDCRAADIIEEFIGDGENFSDTPIAEFRYKEAANLRNALTEAKFGEPLTVSPKPAAAEILRNILLPRKKAPAESEEENALLKAAEILDGGEIVFEENKGGDLLPMLIQAMSGNFDSGTNRVVFALREETLILTHYDNSGNSAGIPLRLDGKPAYFDLERRGDVFRLGAVGKFTADEDGAPVLRVMLCFTETACTRLLKFIFDGDGVTLKFRDSPNLYGAIDEGADILLPVLSGASRKILDTVLESDAAGYQIRRFLEPTVVGEFVGR
ncbi:MAG: beta-lactamase family protein [Ruminococcus sp.]|nr:beta-lactamase family protein [Ruminococcus sp.]MCM1380466.1 beta-lactamase family protein [Muribaculaceae bacterium]MCM1479059.1 beta-lactamase family protein [Muribaculaceae bacterium]